MAQRARLSADDWVTAALEVLVSDGISAVKILPLAKRLGVTRGSFYWHFENHEALLNRLLEVWEETNSGSIIRAATLEGSIVDRYVALMRCWLGFERFDPRLEVAVRNWGRSNPELWQKLRATDERRVDACVEMLAAEVSDPVMRLHRARTIYFLQMGWYELEVDEPMDARIEALTYYFDIYVGRSPTADERAAILAGLRL
ncbi:MAG: TetR/AcrR family transcriptional regulator [Acidimicrobiaceae bacterium]|uniref:TetR/AcrR family transcriptional regulator n=1 Tax=Candidatus Poriferisodalis multihospitum TaxID=2983191 RepID=UPI00137E93DE|nr:TetR/AcrR family transcriptional regulator [Candidatus Poriferisodalis multihospitum]MCY3585853.1 TetR/AcrR family transcriptional regulator [Acidimicrobiaceae bacterium]MXV89011.1 TetR/AcrR family transcriptional regulator [Acidimicrobiales bacterium]MCY3609408.1 TetR/AcrR family transcriptional regulator [Acidimicrobiaceae bacterium]MCY3894682.1 TetR/AcrR family transcriptional regulator [Acidimicrobiaceae bacterium]MCY3949836.1 TetR/AcrR family transcriptional regulator [Acidimicrobiacea